MRKIWVIGLLFGALHLQAQDISIRSGWKFKTGDQPEWSSPAYNDKGWTPISVGEYWESQGYAHYDGFAWYRLHIVIPSYLRDSACFKENLRFDLGKIDDGDEFYLNGYLIGRNAGLGDDIRKGFYNAQRSYSLPVNDPRIFWDRENLVAVRVFDKDLDGGMYGGNYRIRMPDLGDLVEIKAMDNPSEWGAGDKISRKILLRTVSDSYEFTGNLEILVTDPAAGATVYQHAARVDFAKNRPYEFNWKMPLPNNTSYRETYVFREERSKETIKVTAKRRPYVPAGKKLDSAWIKTLALKGDRKIYQGKELSHIAMPCGGIGAGQIEISGEGQLSLTESIYNQMQPPNAGLGFSTGAQYLNPQASRSKFQNGFVIRIAEPGKAAQNLSLTRKDFDDLQFIGEYPMAMIRYRKSGEKLPVEINAEVFSPFVPLSVRNSANPVTIQKFTLTNTGDKPITITIGAWLQNDSVFIPGSHGTNKAIHESGLTGIRIGSDDEAGNLAASGNIPGKPALRGNGNPQYGNLSLCVLDEKAIASVDGPSAEDCLYKLLKDKREVSRATTQAPNTSRGGAVSERVTLAPRTTKTISFILSWYFPNFYEMAPGCPGWVGRMYNNWYKNSFEAAKYIAVNFSRLYQETKLFHDTYYDNSLPGWLANRIMMPVSTLACGNIEIWENGRMYGYEGIGFCEGTTGHVYNFVTTISRLFPELERSVRLLQDLNDSAGFSPSGRINFRGHDGPSPQANHAYASDAQSGYVLKLYREHLMSADNRFLDSVWNKAKQIIGYQIFKDGADIGMEPNGVLEGLQTFWDPMWYGPNPYNNSLYLAALRAAEEMARIKGENDLADRYHGIFEKGRSFMMDHMWNGEYFVHLYPNGFHATGADNGIVSPEETEENAKTFVEDFNAGKPAYFASSSCDAQQLFGQNWARQLGLGYILPPEKCRMAAKSIFTYNWTPDIATAYDFEKPLNRTLAAGGEAAMINGSWPKEEPHSFEQPCKLPDNDVQCLFENTWDKSDVWCGLEYEASCDMINEGLITEALIMLRALHDRYDGLKRNPWNEIEGSDHYVRSMQSWNVLLSLSGYTYDGPTGKIGFSPKLSADDFKSFFSAAEGWGYFSQKIKTSSQQETINIRWGRLRLNTLSFEPAAIPASMTKNPDIEVTLDGRTLSETHSMCDGKIIIRLTREQIIKAGQRLEIRIR